MIKETRSEILPEFLVGVELWVGSNPASAPSCVSTGFELGWEGSRVTLCCSNSPMLEGERSRFGGRCDRLIDPPISSSLSSTTTSLTSFSLNSTPTLSMGVVDSLGEWFLIVDEGEKSEPSSVDMSL